MKSLRLKLALTAAILVVQTSFAENSPATTSTDLLSGANRTISNTTNNKTSPWGKTTSFKSEGSHKTTLRADFTVEDPAQFHSLALKKSHTIKNITLNGKDVKVPIDGMSYRTIPGIPISMLNKGDNQLEVSWETRVKSKKNKETARISFAPAQIAASDINISLVVQQPKDLEFQTGPVLGYAGCKFFTVTCRVNMPAELVLKVNKHEYISKPALLHSFKVEKLSADTPYEYTLTARIGTKASTTVGPYTVHTLPKGGKFQFAALGDSRTYPKDWQKVAAATTKANPAFAIFGGDMVNSGKNDNEWDEQFCTPAKEFLATIPFYGIIGNHESNCPLFTKLFKTPQDSKNWSQQVGSVLFIGIDGAMDWSNDSDLTKWLEKLLAESKAKFIFLTSHYPPWTSGNHGKLNNQGRPAERPTRQGQDVVMPLLEKYNATAMFAGHDHSYERSEPTGGVTMIVTGGAGAPLRQKTKNAAKQNPHSKVFASAHHFCILSVNGDTCSMEVINLEGKAIDTKTWTARN